MAKLYVFGIGGTGSRVLRSFVMMMAAGVKIGVDEVVPIIIDTDESNGNLTTTVTLMDSYESIRSKLNFTDEDQTTFFRKKLSKISDNYRLRINDTNDRPFRQFINLASMDRDTQAMMRMLFSDKNLDSYMTKGFKGNPNIGSVVLNQIVESDAFSKFANDFNEGDKIFIISSIFGGTGASGFPLLLKTLRTGDKFSNNGIINKAEIGAVTALPYFKVEPDSESEIDSSTFISKMKAAMAYYEKNIGNNKSINALYFLDDDMSNTYENHEGSSEQRNDAHLIEFLAAYAIVDFSNNEYKNTTYHELGVRDMNENSSAVTFNSFYDELRHDFFAPLTEFVLMANCFRFKMDYYRSPSFNANTDNFHNFYDSPFMRQLKTFTQSYIGWLDEMKRNKRSLNLFDLNEEEHPFEVVTGCKSKRIPSFYSNYDLITTRLNSAVKICMSKGDNNKFLEMFYLGTSKLIKEKFNV